MSTPRIILFVAAAVASLGGAGAEVKPGQLASLFLHWPKDAA